MIVVERGRYNLKTKHETTQKSYWIYNQVLDDERFNEMTKSIRNHWEVEVHHQIRDKQMGEDALRISNQKESVIVARFLTVAINLLETKKENTSILREKMAKNWKLVPAIFK